MVNRKINWISSIEPGNEQQLSHLNEKMVTYYSEAKTRLQYDQLVTTEKVANPVTTFFIEWFHQNQHRFTKVLEVGCGSGRIWEQLSKINPSLDYTGVEVDEASIFRCKQKWTDQNWLTGTVYQIEKQEQYDMCFSFYVLEHLVFPEKALNIMLNSLKIGGTLFLVFPDFFCTGRFPSQQVGLGTTRSTKELLKKGDYFDAMITWWDIHVNLKPALNNLMKTSGEFLVNTNPACLYYNEKEIWPDIDAVYLSHKAEIIKWAKSKGATVTLPAGEKPPFDQHALISIIRH